MLYHILTLLEPHFLRIDSRTEACFLVLGEIHGVTISRAAQDGEKKKKNQKIKIQYLQSCETVVKCI